MTTAGVSKLPSAPELLAGMEPGALESGSFVVKVGYYPFQNPLGCGEYYTPGRRDHARAVIVKDRRMADQTNGNRTNVL